MRLTDEIGPGSTYPMAMRLCKYVLDLNSRSFLALAISKGNDHYIPLPLLLRTLAASCRLRLPLRTASTSIFPTSHNSDPSYGHNTYNLGLSDPLNKLSFPRPNLLHILT